MNRRASTSLEQWWPGVFHRCLNVESNCLLAGAFAPKRRNQIESHGSLLVHHGQFKWSVQLARTCATVSGNALMSTRVRLKAGISSFIKVRNSVSTAAI